MALFAGDNSLDRRDSRMSCLENFNRTLTPNSSAGAKPPDPDE
jgi:hypothetical protein